MILCKNCEHYKSDWVSSPTVNYDYCTRDVKPVKSLVTGKIIRGKSGANFAEVERRYGCGVEAKFFVQRKSFWMKLFK